MRVPSRCGSLLLALGLSPGQGCDQPASRDARPAAHRRTERPEAVVEAGSPLTDEAAPAATRSQASPDALGADERQRFQSAVAEGRRLHGQRDFEGAIEAYGRALDVLPDDPRTLSELGWATLFTGRLDEAEAVLRRAEAGVGDDDRLRAAILYNLGRVAEARHEDAAAIEAYQRSLRLRPHPSVYSHLSGLEGGTRYAFGPEVRRLQGPYAKIADFCHEERRLTADLRGEEDAESFGCVPDAAKGLGGSAVEVPRARSLPAPWKGLRFVEVRPNPHSVRFHAALRIDSGWFVLPDVAALARGSAGTVERATRLAGRAESLFSGKVPEIVLEVESRWTSSEGSRELESESNRVEFLCGLGPSGIPSCTGALPRATQARRRDAGGVEQTRWTIERRVRPEGVVVLEGDAGALDEPAAALLGAHRVDFL
jgi:tetratricopeptide (TPR) repeat protein